MGSPRWCAPARPTGIGRARRQECRRYFFFFLGGEGTFSSPSKSKAADLALAPAPALADFDFADAVEATAATGVLPVFAGTESGLGRSAARNASTGSVLITFSLVSQARRAVITPYFMYLRLVVVCASVEITTFTPRSFAMRRWTSFRSSRSGYALHSIATPAFFAASRMRSMS